MNLDIPAPMLEIIRLARWAPSGDNMQTWRFEVAAPDHLVVHAYDTRDHCVYDLDGHPSQIAYGALLETIAIAASARGLRTSVSRDTDSPLTHPIFHVRFTPDPAVEPDPLIPAIRKRTVQRRPMHMTPLSAEHKQILEQSVGPDYQVIWIEGAGPKWQAARLMYNNAKLRLTMPEAFETHRSIIHWNVRGSKRGVPDRAIGINPGTLKLMKWAMVSWKRMSTINTLMGTWGPRLELDLLPGMACAAHFVLKAKRKPAGIDDYVAAGRALQRFWLTLTKLGLFMQPEMTPLIFSKYIREGTAFTSTPALVDMARRLERQSAPILYSDDLHPVYMGRLGYGPRPKGRSKRRPIAELLKT
jgi:hypothetical protein